MNGKRDRWRAEGTRSDRLLVLDCSSDKRCISGRYRHEAFLRGVNSTGTGAHQDRAGKTGKLNGCIKKACSLAEVIVLKMVLGEESC